MKAMQPLKARVHNGRLVLDEPTDLPEGEVIELVPVDEVLASGGDYLDGDERARFEREPRAGEGRTLRGSRRAGAPN